jgi:hypothetical protein
MGEANMGDFCFSHRFEPTGGCTFHIFRHQSDELANNLENGPPLFVF